MAKYSKDLSTDIVDKIKNIANSYALQEYGVELEILRLKKPNGGVGEVLKGSDLVKVYAGKENLIVIAIPEELWESVDDSTQTIWTEYLLEQIVSEEDKDGNIKVSVKKPEINLSLGMYHKYGQLIVDKLELAYLTTMQMKEQEKAEKMASKTSK